MTEEELYERCPYNKSHIILKSRMMYHTVKCKKTHRPAHHELASSEHYDEEDDNPRDGSFSSHKNKNATKKVNEEGLELFDVPLPEPEENWDSTETGFSYDPEMKVQSEPLLRCLAVAPKSERKDFRANERRRFFLFDSSSSRYQKGMSRVNNGTGERVPKMSQKK